MGITKVSLAVCKCDYCGAVQEVHTDQTSTNIESLPVGWLAVEYKVQRRVAHGYTAEPHAVRAFCSDKCACEYMAAEV